MDKKDKETLDRIIAKCRTNDKDFKVLVKKVEWMVGLREELPKFASNPIKRTRPEKQS